jgi:hypothetical protein
MGRDRSARGVFAATLLFAFAAASEQPSEKPRDDEYWTTLVESTTPHPATSRLTIGPAALVLGALALEVDLGVSKYVSWHLGGIGVVVPSVYQTGPGRSLTPPLEITTGLRFFPAPNVVAPAGFWLGVAGLFWYMPSTSTQLLPGLSTTVGYTFIDAGGFTFSIGCGLRAVSLGNPYGLSVLINPIIHLNIGFAFGEVARAR